MTRLAMFLFLVLLASALYQVRTQYDSRRLVTQLDAARSDAARLESERRRLEAQRRAEAQSLRVEKLATEKLAMQVVTPAISEYVAWDGEHPAQEEQP